MVSCWFLFLYKNFSKPWVIQVTGIVRTKCENTLEPVTMNDTLEMFDQNLVYNDNLEEGEKVDVE